MLALDKIKAYIGIYYVCALIMAHYIL